MSANNESIKTIQDFIDLLQKQPDLFSAEDRVELEVLCPTWPNDYQEIADAIAIWSESRPAIYEQLVAMPERESNWESELKLPGKGNSVPQPKPEEYKGQLLNAIHRNFTPSPSQPSTPPSK
jgi:hypothetical protein